MHIQIDRTQQVALIAAFGRVQSTGSQNLPHSAIAGISVIKVRTAALPKTAIANWSKPALFIARTDVVSDVRPKVTIYYIMSCGSILSLDLPTIKEDANNPLPKYIAAKSIATNNGGEFGYLVPIEFWIECGNYADFKYVEGKMRKPYYRHDVPDAITI